MRPQGGCPCVSEGRSQCSPGPRGGSRASLMSSSLGRRVASTTQSSQSEAPSCSPFGKKKKCKDKYLAKHSSSKCEPQNLQAVKHGAGAGLAAAQPSGSSHSKKGPQNPRSVSCWDTERACQLLV